jgi:hypothetical protein
VLSSLGSRRPPVLPLTASFYFLAAFTAPNLLPALQRLREPNHLLAFAADTYEGRSLALVPLAVVRDDAFRILAEG